MAPGPEPLKGAAGPGASPGTSSGRSGRLRWYVDRLRAMTLAEIAHRVRELSLRKAYRLRPPDTGRLLLPDAQDLLPDLPELRQGLAGLASSTGLAADFARQAEAVAQGRVTIFGRPWSCIPLDLLGQPVPGWHEGPLPVPDWHWSSDGDNGGGSDSGRSWPADRYCFDIAYRHAGPDRHGDIKFTWELNRLTYLQPVAAHAFLSGDVRARGLCIGHLSNWLDRNPPFLGVNWASGIELAMRCVSLVVVLSLLDPRTLPADLRRRLAESLAAHGFWLSRFPSRHSSANNHLVAELAGLFLLGTLFRGARTASSWAATGRIGLEAEVGRQVLADGSGAEQSPGYAALSLEWFALCGRLAELGGNPFSAAYLDRMAQGGDWLRAIADRCDLTPDIGDADGSSLLAPEVPQQLYPAAVRGMVAQVAGRPDLAPARPVPGLRHALTGLPASGRPEPEGVRCFPDGGITAMRWRTGTDGGADGGVGGEALLLFDHGPLGYLSIAAHGHADALAVWLHLDGRPVLVDAGTWLYFGAGPWRDHFRGTAAHNTLVLQGQDSSRMAGPFNWRSRAGARLLDAGQEGERWWAMAEHDGYLSALGYRHRRILRRDGPGQVTILDELVDGRGSTGTGRPCPVEIGFQFAPDLDLTADAAGWRAERSGAPVLHLRHEGGLRAALAMGGQAPPSGWVSPRFGEKQPAPRLGFHGTMRAGEVQAFVLTIGGKGQE